MAPPKIYINSTEIFWTIRDSYQLAINPDNGARQWTMQIWAGPSALKTEQYSQLIPLLLSSTLTYEDEEGITRQVIVTDTIRITGVLQGYPIISLTVAEPGFDETTKADDPEITGTLDGIPFKTKLSNYSVRPGLIGQFTPSITGKIIQSPRVIEYKTWSLIINDWHNNPIPQVGSTCILVVQYTTKDGVTVNDVGIGKLTSPASLSGGKLSITLQEELP